MSQIMEDGPLREAAILTRAVENVFKKLVRLLLGRMTLVRLQEILRISYIDEAESKIQSDNLGKKVPLTKLALMTGLDTRTLAKVMEERAHGTTLDQREMFLKGITPEASVLDVWCFNAKYSDKETSNPLELKIRGEFPSFESLVRETISTRGVTVHSLLERLTQSGSVSLDLEGQKVSLVDRTYIPFGQKPQNAVIDMALATIGNLIGTVVHNLEVGNHEQNTFFERSYWTNRLNKNDLEKFRKAVREYLETSENGTFDLVGKFEEDESNINQATAGISMFYFEDETTT